VSGAAPPRRSEPVLSGTAWGDVVLSILLLLAASVVVALLVLGAPRVGVPVTLGSIALGAYWLRRAPATTPRRRWVAALLGLPGRHPDWPRLLWTVAATVVGMMGMAALTLRVPGFQPPEGFRSELIDRATDGLWGWLIVITAAGVALPVLEELAFRGIALRALRRRYSTVFAVAASSLLFGLLHAPGGIALILISLGLGIACGTYTVITGTTQAGIAMHVAWNSTLITLSQASSAEEAAGPGLAVEITMLVLGVGLAVHGAIRMRAAAVAAARAGLTGAP
jgi:membrane protease YdiL (CAAX protease family)